MKYKNFLFLFLSFQLQPTFSLSIILYFLIVVFIVIFEINIHPCLPDNQSIYIGSISVNYIFIQRIVSFKVSKLTEYIQVIFFSIHLELSVQKVYVEEINWNLFQATVFQLCRTYIIISLGLNTGLSLREQKWSNIESFKPLDFKISHML